MNDKAKKYYEYLKSQGVNIPDSFESFQSTLQDDGKRKKYYDYLQTTKVNVAPDFDSFSKTLVSSQGVEPMGKQQGPVSGVSPSPSVSGGSSSGLSRSELYNTFQQKREEAESLYKRIEAFKENNTLPALEESQEYIDYLNKKTQLDKLKPTLEEVNSSLEKYKKYFNEDQQSYIFPNEQLMADAQQDFNAAQNLYEQEKALVNDVNALAGEVENKRKEYGYDQYNSLVDQYNKAWSEAQELSSKFPKFEGKPLGATSEYDKKKEQFFEKATEELPTQETSFKDYIVASWNSVLDGLSGFSNNIAKSSGLNDESNIISWLEENKEQYPEFYNEYEKNKESNLSRPATIAFVSLSPDKMRDIGGELETYRKKTFSEDIRGIAGVEQKPQTEEAVKETFLGGALTGLGASIPAMVASAPTMGMSFFDMAYQGADENLKQIKREKGVEMSPLDEEIYKLTIGATNLILERVGLSNLLKGTSMSKSLANYFSSKAYNRLAKEAAESGGKVSKESFDRVVNEEASAFLKYAKGVANGTISEFETGTLQSLAEDFTEQGINIIQGREIFDSKTVAEIASDAIYSGAQEAVGGGIMSSTIGIFATDNPSKKDKVRFMKLIESTDDVEGLKKELKLQIAKNRIDKDQSQRLLDKIDEYSQIIESLPEDLTTEAKVEAVELLQKKKKLETKLAKLDDAFKEPVKKQIEEINNSLRNLEGKTTQVTKTEEDAVQERETEEVPVGEQAQVGEEMVGEVREQAEEVRSEEEVRQREDAVISAIDSNEALNKIDNKEPLNIEEANKAQEELLALIDDLDPARDAELIELIEDEFQRIEDYDNKTETVTETTTERRPVGPPKRVAKIKERKASETVGGLLENSQVETGSEIEGEVSVLELDDDGNIVISRYSTSKRKEDVDRLETGKKPDEVEFVETILDDSGNVIGVRLRIENPKGQPDSPIEFNVVKRNEEDERPLDIAIASRLKEVGDVAEVEFQQAYETVTKTKTKEVPITKIEKEEVTEDVTAATEGKPSLGNIMAKVRGEQRADDSIKKQVRKDVDNAIGALREVAPEVKIVVHETEADYEAAGEEHLKSDGGAYNPKTNTIHINLSRANERTVAHEVFHALLLSKGMGDAQAQKLTDQMMDAVRKTASPELLAKLDQFSSNYESGLQSEESLAELLGILKSEYAKLDKPTRNIIKQWLDQLAKLFGLKNFTDNEIVDLLNTLADKLGSGNVITSSDIEAISEGASTNIGEPVSINPKKSRKQKVTVGNTPEELSLVTADDLIDINSLIEDISSKGQKVWFWVADQLGLGMYKDVQVGKEHYLDAGPSYPLQPENRENNIIWATGANAKGVNRMINDSDYIFIISGSPVSSKMFNKRVFDLLVERVGDFDSFKDGLLNSKPTKPIRDILDSFNSWDDLRNSPRRKQFLIAIEGVKSKKTMTPLKEFLTQSGAFIDMEALRDGFYKKNDFSMNDVMVVLKPTGLGGKSKHSTYEIDILGEVVGVPDQKVNAFDIMPEDLKSQYDDALSESQKSQVVAPYGIGLREVASNKSRKQKLAPNGKPSNLSDINYETVRTPEFKKWFGDWENDPENASKVVDENGEPLVVLHGSSAVDIDVFDRKESGRIGSGLKELGTYFTTNPKVAEVYADQPRNEEYQKKIDQEISRLEQLQREVRNNRDFDRISNEIESLLKKGRVYPVFLNLRKVHTFDAEGKAGVTAWYNLRVKASYKTAVGRDAMEFLSPQYNAQNNIEKRFGVSPVDGIIAKNTVEVSEFSGLDESEYIGDAYLVFDGQPQNIKIADGSNVTFDPDKPSIRQQKGTSDYQQFVNEARAAGYTDNQIREYLETNEGLTKTEIDSILNTEKKKRNTRVKDVSKKARTVNKRLKKGRFYNRSLDVANFLASLTNIGKIKDSVLLEDIESELNALLQRGVADVNQKRINDLTQRVLNADRSEDTRTAKAKAKSFISSLKNKEQPKNLAGVISYKVTAEKARNELENALILNEITESEYDELIKELDSLEEGVNSITPETADSYVALSQAKGNITRTSNRIKDALDKGIISQKKADELFDGLDKAKERYDREVKKFISENNEKIKKYFTKKRASELQEDFNLSNPQFILIDKLFDVFRRGDVYVDDIVLSDKLTKLISALENGYFPLKDIYEAYRYILSERNAEDVVKVVENATKRFKGLSTEEIVRNFSATVLGFRSSQLGKLAKKSKTLERTVYAPLIQAIEQSEKASLEILKEFDNSTKKYSSSFKFLSFNSKRKRNKNIILAGVYMNQLNNYIRRGEGETTGIYINSKDNSKVDVGSIDWLGIILGKEKAIDALQGDLNETTRKSLLDGELRKKYATKGKDLKYMEQVWKELPKNDNGSVNWEEFFENSDKYLDKETQNFILAANKAFADSYEYLKAAKMMRGEPIDNVSAYYKRARLDVGNADIDYRTINLTPNMRVVAGSSIDRVTDAVGAIDFNVINTVSANAVEAPKFFNFEINGGLVNSTLGKAMQRSTVKAAVQAIKTDAKQSIDYTYNTPGDVVSTLASRIVGGQYVEALFRVKRLFIEFTSMFFRMYFQTGTVKSFSSLGKTKTIGKLEDISGIRITPIQSAQIEQGKMSSLRKKSRKSSTALRKKGVTDYIGMAMGVAEITLRGGFIYPHFLKNFNMLTNEVFDPSKLSDPQYLEEYRQVITDAMAITKIEMGRIYPTGNKFAERRNVKLLPFTKSNVVYVRADSAFGRIMSYMSNYVFKESEALSEAAVFTYNEFSEKGFTKKGFKGAATQVFTSRESGVAIGVLVGGFIYSYLSSLNYLLSKLWDDDSDDEEKREASELLKEQYGLHFDVTSGDFKKYDMEEDMKGSVSFMINQMPFFFVGRYGQGFRILSILGMSGIYQTTKNKATKEITKEFLRNNFYTDPVNFNEFDMRSFAAKNIPVVNMAVNTTVGLAEATMDAADIARKIEKGKDITEDEKNYFKAFNIMFKYTNAALLLSKGVQIPETRQINKLIEEEITEKEGGSLNLKDLKPSLPEMPSIF